MVFLCPMSERWKVIVRFIDICGIIDHHCLKFIFMNLEEMKPIYTKCWLFCRLIWLITFYLTSSEQYFMYIQDKNKFTNIQNPDRKEEAMCQPE